MWQENDENNEAKGDAKSKDWKRKTSWRVRRIAMTTKRLGRRKIGTRDFGSGRKGRGKREDGAGQRRWLIQ